jgi:CheY-like chemotaxis protein
MKNILILDDEKEFAEVFLQQLKSLFQESNFEFELFTDPFDALKAITESKYDLIISDHKMPKITGVEFIMNMHRLNSSKNKETPVIILSGYIPQVSSLLGAMNNITYIDKPFEDDQIVKAITDQLD